MTARPHRVEALWGMVMVNYERDAMDWLKKHESELAACGSPDPNRQAHTVSTPLTLNGVYGKPVNLSNDHVPVLWAAVERYPWLVDDFTRDCCYHKWGLREDHAQAARAIGANRSAVRRAIASACRKMADRPLLLDICKRAIAVETMEAVR